MKQFFLIALSVLLTGKSFSQLTIPHTLSKNEKYYRVFPYKDGSFSIFTGSGPGLEGKGNFTTYDSKATLTSERIIDIDGKNETEKGFRHQPSVILNSEQKEIYLVGESKKGVLLRRINASGEIMDALISWKEMPMLGKHIAIQAVGQTSPTTISCMAVDVASHRSFGGLIAFDTEAMKPHYYGIQGDVISEHFQRINYVGTQNNSLVFVSIAGQIMRFSETGEVKTQSFQWNETVPDMYNWTIRPVSFVNNPPIDALYFQIQGNTIYRIPADGGELTSVKWNEEAAVTNFEDNLLYSETQLLFYMTEAKQFYLHESKGEQQLVYFSRRGGVSIYPVNWRSGTVGAFNPEKHFLPAGPVSALDFIPFVEQPEAFKAVLPQMIACAQKDSKCFFNVFTIYTADGSHGILAISGDKSGKALKNVTVTKY